MTVGSICAPSLRIGAVFAGVLLATAWVVPIVRHTLDRRAARTADARVTGASPGRAASL
jgi:hypothetical protein